MNRRCINCRFAVASPTLPATSRYCQRLPAQIIGETVADGARNIRTQWPPMTVSQVCGSHRYRYGLGALWFYVTGGRLP